jgi:hypothetical protein
MSWTYVNLSPEIRYPDWGFSQFFAVFLGPFNIAEETIKK